MYGAIEAGGTKFVCAVSEDQRRILEKVSIPTTNPSETIVKVFEFLDKYKLNAIGIGSFGPIDVNKDSEKYGYITTTPKKGWKNFNFVGSIKNRYQIPVAWTTDVNAAAYGELKMGNARGCNSCLYLTVGTGIGGGAIINGKILEGFGHPEMGHIIVRLHPHDNYGGYCKYHCTCLEGLASGPAIEARYGKKAYDLENVEEVWEIEAYYIAQALYQYTLILRPDKIILGGGVMKQEKLFPLIHQEFIKLMGDYVSFPKIKDYIVPPRLEGDAGVIGCMILAAEEFDKFVQV